MTRNVGILLYDEVEVLDFAGPFEVFSTASRLILRQSPEAEPPFRALTVAEFARPIRARGGLTVMPAHDFSAHPPFAALLVPGGVVTKELQNERVTHWLAAVAAHAEIAASVCTGAFLLANAGLLRGRQVTTHWEDVAELQTMFPDLTVKTGMRWVDEGRIVTSGGISAGIDMSLHLVARLAGEALAVATARQMEFDWRRVAL